MIPLKMTHLSYRVAGLPGQFLQKENTLNLLEHTDGESKFNLFFLAEIVFLTLVTLCDSKKKEKMVFLAQKMYLTKEAKAFSFYKFLAADVFYPTFLLAFIKLFVFAYSTGNAIN